MEQGLLDPRVFGGERSLPSRDGAASVGWAWLKLAWGIIKPVEVNASLIGDVRLDGGEEGGDSCQVIKPACASTSLTTLGVVTRVMA